MNSMKNEKVTTMEVLETMADYEREVVVSFHECHEEATTSLESLFANIKL